jgi:L-amino acid N-acyltransferase YncA
MTVPIRLATPDDTAGILAIYAPYCLSSHVSFETAAPSNAEMRERITRITDEYPWLVAETSGEVAGYVYASQHRARPAYRWAVDVAVYIGRAHQRRGLGRALYTSLFAILREQAYFKAYAGITMPNAGSVGLHTALGFQPVAVFPKVGYKLGRWLDVGWWQLDLQPEIENPPEPRSFRAIRQSQAVAAALAEGSRLLRPQRD